MNILNVNKAIPTAVFSSIKFYNLSFMIPISEAFYNYPELNTNGTSGKSSKVEVLEFLMTHSPIEGLEFQTPRPNDQFKLTLLPITIKLSSRQSQNNHV